MQSYIGITGFTSFDDVAFAIQFVPKNSTRLLMVGALASYKSLRGIPMKEYWAKQTPLLGSLSDFLLNDDRRRRVVNLVHYSSEPEHHEWLADDLIDVARATGHPLDGFQLNIPWPNPRLLVNFHNRCVLRKREIVLQISRASIELAGGTPEGVIAKLGDYHHLAHALLFDMSGGRGEPVDLQHAQHYLRAFVDAGLPFKLGVAGGLGPNSMEPIKKLLEEFQEFWGDARGRLRDANNRLDPMAVSAYLGYSFSLVHQLR